jgi:hypothetical protein
MKHCRDIASDIHHRIDQHAHDGRPVHSHD